jgi:hypothetical protein
LTRKQVTVLRAPGPFALAVAVSLLLLPLSARADESRFAVVDLEPKPENEALRAEVEREMIRLRPGAQPLEEQAMRRLLLNGEGPAQSAQRLVRETDQAVQAGECATAATKGKEAEAMILGNLSLDEEREPLKQLYTALLLCEIKRGRTAELGLAAARLRSLVAQPPVDFPAGVWEKYVANATLGPATSELLVDSDPANASVAVNLHGDGVTPRTLKVPKGVVFVELQKEGFKKAFRAVTVTDRPARAVMRLVPKAQDRTEMAEAQLRLLRRSNLKDETPALSRLSQLVRVETLVLLQVAGQKVTISFFDAERGALTEAPIESRFDPATGKVAALVARGTPAGGGKPAAPAPAPAAPTAAATSAPAPSGLPAAAPPVADKPAPLVPATTGGEAGLPEARAAKQQAQYVERRKKEGAPWWSWLIAGAVGAGFLTFMWSDRPQTAETIKVRASWPPPAAGP